MVMRCFASVPHLRIEAAYLHEFLRKLLVESSWGDSIEGVVDGPVRYVSEEVKFGFGGGLKMVYQVLDIDVEARDVVVVLGYDVLERDFGYAHLKLIQACTVVRLLLFYCGLMEVSSMSTDAVEPKVPFSICLDLR